MLKLAAGDQDRVKQEGEVDRVYRQLRNAILQCEFRPGDFLSEVELARLCKTSRTPVREACSRLAQEQWITRIRHKGYMVPQISVREIVEIYEYRTLLESFTAERAANTATEEQISALRKTIEVEKSPRVTMAAILAVNDRFHLGLAEIARNQRVLDALTHTLEYVHRLDLLSVQRDAEWVPHGDILRAVEARKPSQAKKAMATHIDIARDRMLRLFGG